MADRALRGYGFRLRPSTKCLFSLRSPLQSLVHTEVHLQNNVDSFVKTVSKRKTRTFCFVTIPCAHGSALTKQYRQFCKNCQQKKNTDVFVLQQSLVHTEVHLQNNIDSFAKTVSKRKTRMFLFCNNPLCTVAHGDVYAMQNYG